MYNEHPTFQAPEDEDVKVWRYMDFTKFVSLLDKRSLYFCRVDKLGDPFEGSLTEMNVKAREDFIEELWKGRINDQQLAELIEREPNFNDKARQSIFVVGPDVFDRLTYGQKVSVLSIIGNGMLKPDEPIHKLTAAVEGTIAAVFEHLKTAVIIEIDEPEIKSNWRKMILAARHEVGAEELPKENCEDVQEWLIEIEELSYLILWDADYEDEDLYIDKPPEEAQALKDFMRMRDDYFLEIPEDLKLEEVETRLTDLKNLCRSICKKSEVEKD